MAIALAALTAAAAIGTAHQRWRTLEGLGFLARAERLFPAHLAAVVIFGAIDLLLFGLLIIGTVH